MKKVILSAALCSAAIAFASPANADASSDFWTAAVNAISDWLLGSSSAVDTSNSLAGPTDSDFLSGSTNALVLGATGDPTPTASYIAEATKLYLDPNGYDGTTASTLALTTPETYSFDSSVTQGETDLINSIVADYNAGEMGCNAAGLCSDPLTLFTYSQSSAIAALAEQQLQADKIPDDALRFVMLGANPTGVPDNLYPTEVVQHRRRRVGAARHAWQHLGGDLDRFGTPRGLSRIDASRNRLSHNGSRRNDNYSRHTDSHLDGAV